MVAIRFLSICGGKKRRGKKVMYSLSLRNNKAH